jgi:hypothetical protein
MESEMIEFPEEVGEKTTPCTGTGGLAPTPTSGQVPARKVMKI